MRALNGINKMTTPTDGKGTTVEEDAFNSIGFEDISSADNGVDTFRIGLSMSKQYFERIRRELRNISKNSVIADWSQRIETLSSVRPVFDTPYSTNGGVISVAAARIIRFAMNAGETFSHVRPTVDTVTDGAVNNSIVSESPSRLQVGSFPGLMRRDRIDDTAYGDAEFLSLLKDDCKTIVQDMINSNIDLGLVRKDGSVKRSRRSLARNTHADNMLIKFQDPNRSKFADGPTEKKRRTLGGWDRSGGGSDTRMGKDERMTDDDELTDDENVPDMKDRWWLQRMGTLEEGTGAMCVLRNVIRLAFCGMKVHVDSFMQMYRSNLLPPIGFLLVWPFVTFRMASIVFLSKNAGVLTYAQPTFLRGINADHQLMTFNVTWRFGPMIFDNRKILSILDAAFFGYLGGCGKSFNNIGIYDARNISSGHTGGRRGKKAQLMDYNPGTGDHRGDIFVFPIGISTLCSDVPDYILLGNSTMGAYGLQPWVPQHMRDSLNRHELGWSFQSQPLALKKFGFHMRPVTMGDASKSSMITSQEFNKTHNQMTARGTQYGYDPRTHQINLLTKKGIGPMGYIPQGCMKSISGLDPRIFTDVIKSNPVQVVG
jgi:hypothetical protein